MAHPATHPAIASYTGCQGCYIRFTGNSTTIQKERRVNATPSAAGRPIFIARQPIYDRGLKVFGYELLFRARDVEVAEFDHDDRATSRVIVNSFINIGIERLVGSALAFINVPRQLVVSDAMLPMFHEQTVLELLENVEPDAAVLKGIVRLKARGFRIGLDDFVYDPKLRPLVELADFIKIDVLGASHDDLVRRLAALRPFPARIVAEKVETPEMHSLCERLGFDGYQGYFFCRPQNIRDHILPANQVVVLAILQKLSDPELRISELEGILAGDVALSYKLLRYVNSAAFGLRREIESLKDAIVLVGLNTVRNWAGLLLLDSVNLGRPRELIKVAMVRAWMCERLAEKLDPQIKPQMFITGLFSVLDAVMDLPMERLVDNLALSAPIRFALVSGEGRHGALLRQTLLYEQGDWAALVGMDVDAQLLVETYLAAVHWAEDTMRGLFGPE